MTVVIAEAQRVCHSFYKIEKILQARCVRECFCDADKYQKRGDLWEVGNVGRRVMRRKERKRRERERKKNIVDDRQDRQRNKIQM